MRYSDGSPTNNPAELALCRDSTDCCGTGGGFSKTSPGSAEAAARRIIVQAQERGIERLLSFSPECVTLTEGRSQGSRGRTWHHAYERSAQEVAVTQAQKSTRSSS